MRSLASRRPRFFPALLSILVLGLSLGLSSCGVAQPPLIEGAGPQVADGGMVAAVNAIASRVGAEVLRSGGNAVDAAIATGFALAVVHPSAGNIGGGGFMVIRFPDGTSTALDFREKAPLAAHAEMFLDENGEYSAEMHHRSHLAVGVPGTVAGFAMAHEKYGSGEWGRLVDPAVGLAGEGFELSEALSGSINRATRSMENYPASLAKFSKDGAPFAVGDVWVQSDLAASLERIRDLGRDGFYLGETAALLVAEMERGGGIITAEDLVRYEAKERTPIKGTYRGHDIISMPPPSSGGTALVQMLNILEGYDLSAMGHMSAPYVHHVVEAMRRAFRDRALHMADSDFADPPLELLTSKEYAEGLRAEISSETASVSAPSDIVMAHESLETTHYSVVDSDGMAVSVTYTLESGYGSKIVVPGGGFLLNNEMGDFNAGPGITNARGLIGTEANLARPEQRMLSSMTPTIVAKDGQLLAVVGSPGGRTIINSVLEVVLNVVDFGMTMPEAVAAKRFHHQWLPDAIRIEAEGMTPEAFAFLEAMGHTANMAGGQGSTPCIMLDPETGKLVGAPDPRDRDGGAVGY